MEIFKNGSQWLKVDFHLHTKADKEFKYELEINDFCNKYIEKLKENSINIGVITNHNKFDVEEYKALKKKAQKEEIFIMAGVELSVNDGSNGVHTLIVFDYENWVKNGDNFIEQFLSSAFEGIANRENENTACRYSIKDLFSKLEEHRKNQRESFVIMAHIEQDKGLLKEIDGGRLIKLFEDELFHKNVLGMQKLRTFDNMSKFKQWFSKEDKIPVFIEGSDCKKLDEVGKMGTQKNQGEDKEKVTYIKIGDFNFEAVKNALIDKNNRVSADKKPMIKNSYIKSIHIESGSKGLLSDVTINFSPEMNNLIGIRGSGKSSILEIVRYVLDIPLTTETIDKKYKEELISFVLKSGAKMSVNIVNQHNKEYRIEKIYGQKEDIFEVENNVRIESSLDGIFFKKPVYFGQKDLSNKDVNFESNLVYKLIGHKLENAKLKTKEKVNQIKQVIIKLKEIENIEELKKETLTKKADSEQKIKIYQEKGIEAKLKVQSEYDADLRRLKSVTEKYANISETSNKFIKDFANIFDDFSFLSEKNDLIFKQAENIVENTKKEIKKVSEIFEKIVTDKNEFENVVKELETKIETLKDEFAKIKREIDIPSLNPDDFLNYKRIIETSETKLIEITKLEDGKMNLEKELIDRLTELNSMWLEEYRIIEKEVEKINNGNNQLEIIVDFKENRDSFINKQNEFFKGSKISTANYEKISNEYKDFIEIYRDSKKLSEILNDNQYIEYKKRLNENLEELITFRVEDKYTILYNKKPLNNHSLGQRATALILFLLAQKDTDILIIDQPEDDLDNQTIYNEVIKKIKELKGEMQFIFATHNANIPVLGDSEKIIACEFTENKIKIEGGNIDTKLIQNKIVDVMEGGEEAFMRRKDIYNLWKVRNKL